MLLQNIITYTLHTQWNKNCTAHPKNFAAHFNAAVQRLRVPDLVKKNIYYSNQ